MSSPDNDAQREHEPAIRRLLAEYCHAYDDGRSDDFGALFTDDATFTVMGATTEGRDAIRSAIGTRAPDQPPGQHVTYNSVIEVADDGATARARTDFCYLTKKDGALSISTAGRYHDELRRDPDRWRLARRTIVFLGDQL